MFFFCFFFQAQSFKQFADDPQTTDKHFVCLTPNVSSQFALGYRTTSGILPLTSTLNLSSSESFSVELFLISSPSFPANHYLKTFQSYQDYSCITLTDHDIQSKRQINTNYYVKLSYSFSGRYSYYMITGSETSNLGTSGTFQQSRNYPFSSDLYLGTSPYCTDYKLKTFTATTSQDFISIDDSIVPQQCIVQSQTPPLPPLPPTPPPAPTMPSQSYFICVLNPQVQETEISYTVSFESGQPLHVLSEVSLSCSSSKEFSAKFYLTKSEICENVSYLTEITATSFTSCTGHFQELELPTDPKDCVYSDTTPDNQSSGGKTTIIIIACVAAFVCLALIAVIVIVIKKRRNKHQYDATVSSIHPSSEHQNTINTQLLQTDPSIPPQGTHSSIG